MVIAAAAVPGGTSWTDVLTAVGTVGAVIVAVAIALFADYRSGERIKEERGRSDRVLAEQRAQDKAAIEDERAHGRVQLEEERQVTRDREQLAGAYAVQVTLAERAQPGRTVVLTDGPPARSSEPKPQVTHLAALVRNLGSFTITRVEAVFCSGNSIVPHRGFKRLNSFANLPESLKVGYKAAAEINLNDVLTPFDLGMRFESHEMTTDQALTPYPIVRWTDQWGTRWEHKLGVVRQVPDGAPWEP
jgi:hypothetical protein